MLITGFQEPAIQIQDDTKRETVVAKIDKIQRDRGMTVRGKRQKNRKAKVMKAGGKKRR